MTAVRALNRVLMSLGEPSGTARDWLQPHVVVLLQMGLLRLPIEVRNWFDAPAACPEAMVAAWLIERPDSGLAISFCAAYLHAQPRFLRLLERIWTEEADTRKSEPLCTVGALLAGAHEDCSVSPVELRCCLGHEIGGPLEESSEMLGQLVGIVMTQKGEIRQSAEELLAFASPHGRRLAGCCLKSLKRNSDPFAEGSLRWNRFGVTSAPLIAAGALPQSVQPLFSENPPACCDPKRLLEALALPGSRSKNWAQASVEWDKPESVKRVFERTDSAILASSFLQSSASAYTQARQLAGLLAAGIGQRLLETAQRDRVVQRVAFLAAHDPEASVRAAGCKAAVALGIPHGGPNLPTSPRPPEDKKVGAEPSVQDPALDELLRELENGLGD